jgi:phage terminase large subunit-like protein
MKRIEFIDPNEFEPGAPLSITPEILAAIRCLEMEKLKPRNWRLLPDNELTTAEASMRLLETVAKVPSGNLVGRPLRFMFFQEIIFYILLDVKPAIFALSMARRNGKTFILACIVIIHLVSHIAIHNSIIASAAMSRDQAALIYKEIENMLAISPQLQPFIKAVPSGKRLTGIIRRVEYMALAAEARTGFGRSYKLVVLDEAGQIVGPDNDYVSMLRSSQGSVEDPVFAIISTQAASDSDYLSVTIDAATRDQSPNTAVLVFETPKHMELDDEVGWYYSNPGLGVFRSIKDMAQQAYTAKQIPESEARFRNLNLNQRVARHGLWLPPGPWKDGRDDVDIGVFRNRRVTLGIDLSTRTDLTSACLAAEDDEGITHLMSFSFAPEIGVEQREMRDKAPYQLWSTQGLLQLVPGSIITYDWVAEYLKKWCDDHGIDVTDVCFDRWRIEQFKKDCARIGAFQTADWHSVGQGFKDMSPRMEHFEAIVMGRRVRHGGNPLLNMAVGAAVAQRDPAGNRKIAKEKSSQRIDPIVAAVMAAFGANQSQELDEMAWIA